MNKYPEMYASTHDRRPCVRRPFYHNNQKIYLEVQYCPDTGNMNVIKIHPEMKDGTILAQQVLSAIFRTGQFFRSTYIIDQ